MRPETLSYASPTVSRRMHGVAAAFLSHVLSSYAVVTVAMVAGAFDTEPLSLADKAVWIGAPVFVPLAVISHVWKFPLPFSMAFVVGYAAVFAAAHLWLRRTRPGRA